MKTFALSLLALASAVGALEVNSKLQATNLLEADADQWN